MRAYEDVNKGLQEVIDYLNSIENVWNKTRNFKLYDAFYQAPDIIKDYPRVMSEHCGEDDPYEFHHFCENEYECFEEWIRESNIDDSCINYIGRTSSFYLSDIHGNTIGEAITELMDKIGYYGIDFKNDGHIEPFHDTDYYTETELVEENQEAFEYMADGGFLRDTKEYLSDAVKIADYIDTFKEHQVENFKEYLEGQEDILEYMEKKEEEQEQAFIEKYADAIAGLTSSIEEVIRQTGCTTADITHMIGKSMEQVKPLHVLSNDEMMIETA